MSSNGEVAYDVAEVPVMHMLHPLQSDPSDVSTSVRLGFDWAERTEGQGIFLCTCTKPCLDTERCGRTFFENAEDIDIPGESVELEMPWVHAGHQVVFAMWCCANCNLVGTGSVFDVWVGRFYDMPARLLQWEHESRARSYAGLRKSMQKYYPDSFTEGAFVTLVMYRRTT